MEEKQLLILRLIGYFDYRFEQVSDILYRDKEAGHHVTICSLSSVEPFSSELEHRIII